PGDASSALAIAARSTTATRRSDRSSSDRALDRRSLAVSGGSCARRAASAARARPCAPPNAAWNADARGCAATLWVATAPLSPAVGHAGASTIRRDLRSAGLEPVRPKTLQQVRCQRGVGPHELVDDLGAGPVLHGVEVGHDLGGAVLVRP